MSQVKEVDLERLFEMSRPIRDKRKWQQVVDYHESLLQVKVIPTEEDI